MGLSAARVAAGASIRAGSPAAIAIHPIADAEWPALCAYDAAVFGADRSAVLARMRGRLPPAESVSRERDGRIAGMLLGRDGRTASHLGPLIAEDDAIAQALLARALSGIDGPVYIDLADAKADVRALARSMRLFGAAAVHPHAARPRRRASTTRRAPSR